MSVVTKVKSGFIYESDFSSLSSQWEVSDLNRIELGNGLLIKGGENTFYMYFNQLTTEKQFVIDVKNVYNPKSEENRGGILVYADENLFIALEEYDDSLKGTAEIIMFIQATGQRMGNSGN